MSDPDRLPLNNHVDAGGGPVARPKPTHLSWESIGLVALGGMVGTGLRYLITVVTPRWSGVPVATLGINVIGAFLLGVLLELLAERSIDAGRLVLDGLIRDRVRSTYPVATTTINITGSLCDWAGRAQVPD